MLRASHIPRHAHSSSETAHYRGHCSMLVLHLILLLVIVINIDKKKGRKREGGRSFGKTPLYLLELTYQEKPSVFTINSLYSPSSVVVVHSFVAGTLKERILQPESADDTLHIRNNGRQLGRSECWLWWIMEPISAKCNTKPSQLMSDKQCCQTNVETLS